MIGKSYLQNLKNFEGVRYSLAEITDLDEHQCGIFHSIFKMAAILFFPGCLQHYQTLISVASSDEYRYCFTIYNMQLFDYKILCKFNPFDECNVFFRCRAIF